MQRKQLRQKLHSKAFTYQGAGGSLRDRVYTEGGEALAIAGASLLSSIPLGKREKEPRGAFGVGLSFLEYRIYHLALADNRKALKEALYLYLELWGVLC